MRVPTQSVECHRKSVQSSASSSHRPPSIHLEIWTIAASKEDHPRKRGCLCLFSIAHEGNLHPNSSRPNLHSGLVRIVEDSKTDTVLWKITPRKTVLASVETFVFQGSQEKYFPCSSRPNLRRDGRWWRGRKFHGMRVSSPTTLNTATARTDDCRPFLQTTGRELPCNRRTDVRSHHSHSQAKPSPFLRTTGRRYFGSQPVSAWIPKAGTERLSK